MVKLTSFGEIVEYDKVEKLDLQNGGISLKNRLGGGWCTFLPISPPAYQKVHTTLSLITVFVGADEITFKITDDYGCEYTLTITEEEMDNPIVQDEVERIVTLQKQAYLDYVDKENENENNKTKLCN